MTGSDSEIDAGPHARLRRLAAAADPYLIWSHEHGSWWGAAGHGYVQSMSEAGQYTREAALRLCMKAIPGTADRMGALPDLPVRLADVLAFTSGFLAEYPGRGGKWS